MAKGNGVARDYVKAAKCYLEAAEQGDKDAQFNLGTMYAEGLGITQDYAEAEKWWRKAAKQGDMRAQSNLGVMYMGGRGIERDYVRAHAWLVLAAVHGDDLVREYRDRVAMLMTPEEIAEAQKLAARYQSGNFGGE